MTPAAKRRYRKARHVSAGTQSGTNRSPVSDGTELCSLVTEKSRRKLRIKEDDHVWVMFNSFAVILHVD